MLTIHYSKRFKRSFKKLPLNAQQDFSKKIEIFALHPFQKSLHTHKLKGKLSEYYAFYLVDGYRVLFDFIGSEIILLVNIGSHDDYKKWGR